jgi:hypothetical protein
MKSRRRYNKKRSAYRKKRHNFSRTRRGGFLGYESIPFFSKKTSEPVTKNDLNDKFGISSDDIKESERLSQRLTNDLSENPRVIDYDEYEPRLAESEYPEYLKNETQYAPPTPAEGGRRRTKRRHHKRKGTHKRRQ